MSKSLRSQRAHERRQQLINAAIEVIADVGLEATTTRKVAEQSGLPLSSVHHTFTDKDELICAVIDFVGDQVEALRRDAQHPQARKHSTPENAVREALFVFWSLVEDDPSFQLMQFELMIYCLRHPDSHWMAQRQYDRNCALVANALRTAVEGTVAAGGIDIEQTARLILAALDGIVLHFLVYRDRERAKIALESLASACSPYLTGGPGSYRGPRSLPATLRF